MAARILTDAQQALLDEERRLLGDARVLVARLGVSADEEAALADAAAQLDGFFLLVVVGEFNSGKSALINALLHENVLAEGVTPTTAQVTLVRHREGPANLDRGGTILHVQASSLVLRDLHIVDTPGTNAILREHEVLTSRFVPRSDLVLFVTSADRPFTETERAFLQTIRDWGKRVVVVVNKIDILESDADVARVARFVDDGVRTLLGIAPPVFPVSARLARRGHAGDAAAWTASRLDALERYVFDTLDQAERVRLKLLSPLGVADRVAVSLFVEIEARLSVLEDDRRALEDVERQNAAYAFDMARDFDFRMADVEKLLLEMEQRGHTFFDETLRLGRVVDLLNRSRIEQGFAETVVADTPKRIERKVSEIVDWLVDAEFRHWQAVSSHVAKRQQTHGDRILGSEAARRFHQERSRLVESLARQSEQVVRTFDHAHEARTMAGKARSAVAASAAVEVGAVGLGAVLAAVTTTAAADVTGLAMAGVLAILGFLVIPDRRRRAKKDMRDKVTALRVMLAKTLRTEFEDELKRSAGRVGETIEPYSRFVRAEHDRLISARASLESLRAALDGLRGRIVGQLAR
ncbi:MAG: dynamin family protein [Acidobacteriota bacterium]